MEKHTPGNKKMPNFNQLTDRIIAEPSKGPFIVMKTNLDNNSIEEENPYFEVAKEEDKPTLREFFEDK